MKEKWITRIFFVLCCLSIIVSAVIVGMRKEQLHQDEYYSYGMANSEEKYIDFENGVVYEDPESKYLEMMSARENSILDYSQVYSNLARNIHLPIFYISLHFVCALFPNTFSIWYAVAVNIFYAIINLIFFHKILASMLRSRVLTGILSLAYCCTLGLCSNIIFLRMYVVAMAAVTCVTWEVLRYLRGSRTVRDTIKIAAASVFCAMSHLYCLVYLFFVCAVVCILMMCRKQWKDVARVCVGEAGAGCVSLAIFPPIVRQLLSSNRGREAVSNFSELTAEDNADKITYFYNQINTKEFGGCLPIVLLLLIALAICVFIAAKTKKLQTWNQKQIEIKWTDVILLVVPSLCYFFLISRIAAYKSVRYLYPVFSVAFIGCISLLAKLLVYVVSYRVLCAALASGCVLMSALSWNVGSVQTLYEGKQEEYSSVLEKYQGTDAVLFWKRFNGLVDLAYPEMKYYGTGTFYFQQDPDELESVAVFEEGKNVMVMIDSESDQMIDRLRELYPQYSVEKCDLSGSFTHYYFYIDTEDTEGAAAP